ncbi:MAG TPA: hypothetical protein VG405_01940 [Solirubrobacteraceae bacterium]|nr:hypothetical protein [Solirubrobacteraceae bacterium]
MSAQSFFTPLLQRDASGRAWLRQLLRAAPRGVERLGADLVDQPGSLSMSLSVRGVSGVLGAFEYPLAPSRGLVGWLLQHPQALTWVDDPDASPQTRRLRRALLFDDPPGSRVKAQARAQELMLSRSVLSQEWWRFEYLGTIDCLLMTDRVVLTVITDAADPRAPATPWYPGRPRLIRAVEAARELAAQRTWACLLLSAEPIQLEDELLSERALADAAPHLPPAERAELGDAYLGNLTWPDAAAAIGDGAPGATPARPDA